MTITRYSQWNQPHRFQDELKQVFDRFFGEMKPTSRTS
jgi:hypothetical protein